MNKLDCDIVRDLLPSYVDGLTSETTNAAVSEHISSCEPCADALAGMKTPETPSHSELAQVDYLKKVRRRSRRTAILCALGAAVLVICALAVQVLVIGRQVDASLVMCEDVSVAGRSIDITGVVFDEGIYVLSTDVEEADGVVTFKVIAVPRMYTTNSAFSVNYLAHEDIREIRCGDIIVWQDGVPVNQYIFDRFSARNPYAGDMPANAKIAGLLGIGDDFGEYTNELFTASEPYGWKISISSRIPQEDTQLALEIMQYDSCMMLALVGNLGFVTWEYTTPDGKQSLTIDTAAAGEIAGMDIKQCGESAAGLQRLEWAVGRVSGIPIDESLFELVFQNESDSEIYGIVLDCYINGDLVCTHGMQNADGSALSKGTIASFGLMELDLPEDMTLADKNSFTFDLSVTDRSGKSYPIYKQISAPVSYRTRYSYVLYGTFEQGFGLSIIK